MTWGGGGGGGGGGSYFLPISILGMGFVLGFEVFFLFLGFFILFPFFATFYLIRLH